MGIIDQLKSKLHQSVIEAVLQAGIVTESEMPEFIIESPKDDKNGDFATNVAMQLTKIAKKNPRQIAEAVVEHLDKESIGIEKVEIAGPGFINFYMSYQYLYDCLDQILQHGEKFGASQSGAGRKVQVEFVSANPTGSLHLGHARWAAVGDTLSNLLEFVGYDVTREFYINDAGNQIDNLGKSVYARYLQALGQEGEMPEGGYFGQDIIEIGQQLADTYGDKYISMDEESRHAELKEFALQEKLANIKKDLKDFGVEFDVWFSERSLYQTDEIPQALDRLKDAGYLFEQDQAMWLASTKLGDDKDRVLVKSDGSFTYLTPDIAYHRNKFERGFEKVINIWGQDHHGYVARMKAAMDALGYDRNRLTVLLGQLVNLYQDGELVRMSKRTGKAVTLAELIQEVGVDATRYFFTMRSIDTHLDFDLDLAKTKSNENPVFYVQYAHARICSIKRQIAETGLEDGLQASRDAASQWSIDSVNWSLLSTEHDIQLIKKLAELPSELAQAAEQLAPHRIIRYAFDLATAFHSFYTAQRVLSEDIELTKARYGLVLAVQQTLQNTLRILGISAPEKM
ncbi:arginine--tRNA ligase [Desulfuribacillus stibiiarsenatis]|uniref:Arginine--tRNA ligase n=1 Tax=Desulfuribacillus stibiiarsenatis TaxID=1390249 RepID=A0A1E5L5F2_9FIRM|nr:arginine--tRNA ligase [Desulfuribacillus stibiiarsenatis]OEH85392.1 arginine--tRNA ligase [Desulfuribacillus stibiiarsenatis]